MGSDTPLVLRGGHSSPVKTSTDETAHSNTVRVSPVCLFVDSPPTGPEVRDPLSSRSESSFTTGETRPHRHRFPQPCGPETAPTTDPTRHGENPQSVTVPDVSDPQEHHDRPTSPTTYSNALLVSAAGVPSAPKRVQYRTSAEFRTRPDERGLRREEPDAYRWKGDTRRVRGEECSWGQSDIVWGGVTGVRWNYWSYFWVRDFRQRGAPGGSRILQPFCIKSGPLHPSPGP